MIIEIAGVKIQIAGKYPLFTGHQDKVYEQFFREDTPHYDIHVEVTLGDMHDGNGLRKIFDAEESWSMFRDETNYYVSFFPPSFNKPFWIAKMNSDFSKADIRCSDYSIHMNGDTKKLINPVHYPLDQILLVFHLASREGVLFHAAAIEIKKKSYLFAGRSGAGKTTLSRQFIAKYPEAPLSDDRVFIRKIDGDFLAFGTPWYGEGGFAINRGVPLGGIFFLAQSNANIIEEITLLTTIEKLLPIASIPWYDPEPMKNILDYCDDLIAHIPAYILHFKPDTEIVDVFEQFIS
jgi:hypothetical protein